MTQNSNMELNIRLTWKFFITNSKLCFQILKYMIELKAERERDLKDSSLAYYLQSWLSSLSPLFLNCKLILVYLTGLVWRSRITLWKCFGNGQVFYAQKLSSAVWTWLFAQYWSVAAIYPLIVLVTQVSLRCPQRKNSFPEATTFFPNQILKETQKLTYS